MTQPKQLDKMLCFQISRTHQMYNKFYQKPLKEFHLTYVQYVTLLSLWNQDNVTVNHLSEELGLTNGTLTPMLKRLANAGWITRKRDKRDERRVLISLTNYGKEKQDVVLNTINSCLLTLNLSDEQLQEDLKVIYDIQRRLHNSIVNNVKD